MTEYSEDLMQRLLDAVVDKPAATTPSLVMFASAIDDDVQDARLIITQVLDALGLRGERESRPVVWADTGEEHYRTMHRRYMTEWEEI